MRSAIATLALALAATLAVATPSHAFFHITTVACDTIQTYPLQVRTAFTLDLVGPGSYCDFSMYPVPAGPAPGAETIFYSAAAPAGWSVTRAGYRSLGFYFSAFPNCFGGGSHFEGFQVVANRAGPCAQFIFGDPVLNGAMGEGCLILDGPVPAAPASWGQVKSIYRQ